MFKKHETSIHDNLIRLIIAIALACFMSSDLNAQFNSNGPSVGDIIQFTTFGQNTTEVGLVIGSGMRLTVEVPG